MAAGTISVSPVGQQPTRDIFSIIGEKVKKAKDQAIEARQEADERIEDIENIPEEERTEDDVVELDTLKEKRSQKAYFFKKALKFQATDKIKTTMGKFQRDPKLENDPAATEKERFYAKTGMFRPGEMPDMSSREDKNNDIIGYVGKGFQMIMDAIDKVKARVNRTAESTEQTSKTASSTESTTESVSRSTENLSNSTENISNVSKSELNVQQSELRSEQLTEQRREQAEAEARSEAQSDTAGTTDVIETNQGGKGGQSGGLFSKILDVGSNLAGRRRFSALGRRGGGSAVPGRKRRAIGNRLPGSGVARLARMRAGRAMSPTRRSRAYSAPIGPQPMNSSTPWAKGNFDEDIDAMGNIPRLPSSTINLSQGGIIAPIKPKKQQKLADGGITGLISSLMPPPMSMMMNMMLGGAGKTSKSGGAGAGSSGFQMLTNPTKLVGEGLRAVLPMNRGVGKDVMGGDKSEIENMTKIFQLPTLVGGGIMFASIAQIAKAIPFLGSILNAAQPIIRPILEAFGLPASILGSIFVGPAGAATMDSGVSSNGYRMRARDPDDGGDEDPPPPPPPTGDPIPMGPSMTATGGSLPSKNVSSPFGRRDTRIPGASKDHKGIDISGGGFTSGAAISVIKPGVVEETGDLGSKGWGKYVVIKHDDGTYTLYGHLSQINVKKGNKIENKSGAAKVIGKVGSTGVSSGAHLHFELGSGWNGTITNPINPASYIDNYVRGGGQVKVDAVQVSAAPATAAPSPIAAAVATPAATPTSNRPTPGNSNRGAAAQSYGGSDGGKSKQSSSVPGVVGGIVDIITGNTFTTVLDNLFPR